MAPALEIINIVLLSAGGICALGVLAWLLRSGQWRNPLAGTAVPLGGPTIVGLGTVLLAYMALLRIAVILFGGTPSGDAPTPGSDTWHRLALVEHVARTPVLLLMVVLLVRARRAEPGGRPSRPATCVLACVLALLVLLPLTALQAQMGRIVWHWFYPDESPPLNAVLQALGRGEWGVGGVIQLVVGAVVVAPLTEELFFRGMLLQALCFHLRRAWLAIVASAFIFGLVHAPPQDVLPMVSMGVVLGYLRLRCGVLWPCVLLHALFNARTMVFVLLAPELLNEA